MEHTYIEQWEKEFDEKFGLYSNYADFCPSKEEYKSFIKSLRSKTRTETLMECRGLVEEPDELCEDFDTEEGVCNVCNGCKVNQERSRLRTAIDNLINKEQI